MCGDGGVPGYLQAGEYCLGGGVAGEGLFAGEQGLARSNDKEGSERSVEISDLIVFLEMPSER